MSEMLKKHSDTLRTQQALQEFIQWCGSAHSLELGKRKSHYLDYSVHSLHDLICEFVGVDRVQLENERQALLNALEATPNE